MVFSSCLCLIECSFFCNHKLSTADTNKPLWPATITSSGGCVQCRTSPRRCRTSSSVVSCAKKQVFVVRCSNLLMRRIHSNKHVHEVLATALQSWVTGYSHQPCCTSFSYLYFFFVAIRSGMQTWRNSPASDWWNRSQTHGCRRAPSTGHKRLPTWVADRQSCHQPREWEDWLWNKESDIVWSKLQHYAIYIQTSSPIQPLSESCCHPCINDVMKGYTDLFDEDFFNLGHCILITLTINLMAVDPINWGPTVHPSE